MNPKSLQSIAEMCGARLSPGGEALVRRVQKDTRTLLPGDLYFALEGEKFDGHRFVSAAAAAGAAGAVVREGAEVQAPEGFPLLVAGDPLHALQRLASEWRMQLGLTAICLTGSSGKTSTKEFLAAVLGEAGKVCATEGNLNNHIGLPLSVLGANLEDRFAVWEIGMNHPGEIAPLAAIARPDIAVVTNIGTAHLEFFESREGIAKEKGSLFAALGEGGLAVYPAADDYAKVLEKMAGGKVVAVGLEEGEPRAEQISVRAEGMQFLLVAGGESQEVRLRVHGMHMVQNALLAAAVGLACGLSLQAVARGLSAARPVKGRLEKKEIRGFVVLDDTYNANPDSMVAALRTLAAYPGEEGGKRFAVLGKMGELGEHAAEGYRRVGEEAARCADVVVVVGEDARGIAEAARGGEVFFVGAAEEASALLKKMLSTGDTVLVKGSRSARMEKIVEQIV